MPNPASRFAGAGEAQSFLFEWRAPVVAPGDPSRAEPVSGPTPMARSRTGRWSVTAARATARLMLSSEAANESFVLSGSGPAMSLDGRWQGVSRV